MLKADGPAVRNLWIIDCNEACVTAAVRTSFILDMSTLELLSCSVACKAGSNCLRRFGSWSNGGIGDCGTGETGIAEADVGGTDVGFSPEAEDVEGVVQECETDLSPDVGSK